MWVRRCLSVPVVMMSVMASEPRALRRIADPVLAAAPAGVRIRTRVQLTDAEASALGAVGSFLGSVYRTELAGRVELGRLDHEAHAAWRARRKQALTGVSSSRWAGAITRAVEDQYQLGMRALSAHLTDLRRGIEVLEQRCALRPGAQELAPAAAGGGVAGPPGGSRGRVGCWASVDRGGRETVVAQPQPPRTDRHDPTAVAGPLEWRADVPHC